MMEYRLSLIDGVGRLGRVLDLQCQDDADAIEVASVLASACAMELWHSTVSSDALSQARLGKAGTGYLPPSGSPHRLSNGQRLAHLPGQVADELPGDAARAAAAQL